MLIFKKVLEPEYFKHFKCISSACCDTCCIGWDVVVDKDTYDGYRHCNDISLKTMFDEFVQVNNDGSVSNSSITYARIKMDNYRCPFLTYKNLCFIQEKVGEESLAITCDFYPRVYNNVNGILERSLYLSCPASAELILLNKNTLQFDMNETLVKLRGNYIPLLMNCSKGYSKPYHFFYEIRTFIIALLQNREYPLWQRLLVLSLFCSRVNEVPVKHYDSDIPLLIVSFNEKLQAGEFIKPMNDAVSHPEMQLQIMKILMEHRLNGAYVNERFLECVDKFRCGLGDTDGIGIEVISQNYVNVYERYYKEFMKNHEYILENYLVNYVFKNLFPFGPQKSIYLEQESIYTEYVLLILHFSLIKTLLIGIAGYYKENLNTNHVITLIQTFAKAIEHNIPYLKQSAQFIEKSNMNNISGMTILIKN